jgi:Flp pilus assembly pilin Flp
MIELMKQLWNDDGGAVIAIEFLFFITILIVGIIAGLVGVRAAVVAELTELANAILALSEGYSFSGLIGCCSFADGSQAIDTPGFVPGPVCTPPAIPSPINVLACQ